MKRSSAVCALAILAACLWPHGDAAAAGFYINEQSARGLGRAFSGETALGDDASSLWYNPAHAVDLGRAATLGVSGVFTNGEISDRGSTLTGPGPLPTRPIAGRSGEPLDPAAVPTAAFALPISENVALGASVNAPFGLVVAYPSDFFGRYDSTRTELLTGNFQAGLAWRPHPRVSIGVAGNAQYAEAVLESALPVPGGPDGRVSVKGNDWAYGWNVGAVWRATEDFTVAAHYRSAIEHELEGSERISGLTGPLASANRVGAGRAQLETPAIASVGAAIFPAPRWTLTGQLNWFEWSRFREIRVQSPGGTDLVRPQNYDNAISASLGLEREITPQWRARGGVMVEQTPTQPGFRSTRVPDSDRLWLTAGASYTPAPGRTFDAGLAYVRLADAEVERADLLYEGTPAATRLDLRSRIEGDALIASLGATFRF